MTSTIASTSQAVTEWIKIFPKQATENYTSSVTFMKQLTVVAISTITYLKHAFPEDSYIVETFGGIRLRIIKKVCQDECAQFLSTSLTQAFEAFDKRYLHQLALCFYEEECKIENLIEYHIFDYSYHGDGVAMNVHSKNRDNINNSAKFTFENVRERTINMIRSCVVIMEPFQNQLPSTYNICLRLYYNEDAPWDYQAPGFLCADEGADHLAGSLGEPLPLGWVETAFHKLQAHSYFKNVVDSADAADAAEASHEAIASQNPPTITLEDVRPTDLSPGAAESPSRLRCPCNVPTQQDAAPPPALLTCHYCRWQQHAACFGVRREHAALVTRHCCAACHDAERTRTPTDARLAPLTPLKRECLCIYRRALEWAARAERVSGAGLVAALRVAPATAAKLLRLLHSHRVLALPTAPTQDAHIHFNTPQKIDGQRLQSVMGRFFNAGQDDLVDRLLAETYASQPSQPSDSDPLSEVLSPLEKVSLQNASIVGKVVPVEADGDAAMEDPTLQKYRQAILSADTEEELANVASVTGGSGGARGAQGARGGVTRRTVKRKADVEARGLGLRSDAKSKRGRTASK